MIVSFHPLIRGNRNLLCAGRDPKDTDLAAIRSARAVILPQGCRQSLYAMARENCPHVFPNYDARFSYPGKTGQIRLFRETGTAHPATDTYPTVADFLRKRARTDGPGLPCVFKYDWGGGGETVFLLRTPAELKRQIDHAATCEASGQSGFLIQEYVATDNRSLRVVVIGERLLAYWRVGRGAGEFCVSLSKGAAVDTRSDPGLVAAAKAAVIEFCGRTGLDLAGFDLLFAAGAEPPQPLMLEINYFFGRAGLGGSEAFQRMLGMEVRRWLKRVGVGLNRAPGAEALVGSR